ncbi:MAG: GNAT family N-acetyltransferase, partial [Odoribacter sp.]|nr:GNAT family N-acetyltransferase [Odoribacter sp.]
MNIAEKCDGVKTLWKQCFTDTDTFVDFYFEKKFKEENTIIIEYENQIVSALQMLPYSMTWNGKQIEVSYISGASTHPDFRNKGLIHKLLTEAFIITKSRRIALSILIPQEEWLTQFYEKSGYASVFGYTPEKYELPTNNADKSVQVLSREEWNLRLKELYDYFACYMLDCNYCVLHDFDDFLIILEEMYLEGGKLFIYKNENENIRGMAFAVPEDKHIRIKELLYEGEKDKKALLYSIANEWNNGNLVYNARPQ